SPTIPTAHAEESNKASHVPTPETMAPKARPETPAPQPSDQAPARAQSTINPSDPDSLTGVVIDNRYEIFGRIGEGGMSAIYRGKHLFMDRPVAIKILHKHLTASEKVRERFRQEARTAFVLRHPNIVSVHDFGEAQGFFYLVMDYVDGLSLSELIRVVDHLPP